MFRKHSLLGLSAIISFSASALVQTHPVGWLGVCYATPFAVVEEAISSSPASASPAPSMENPESSKPGMSLSGLFDLERVADPQISPDGKQIVYQVTKILDSANNKSSTQLWLANFDGSGARQLTQSGSSNSHPRWSPDGSRILFQSNRDGSLQIYILDLASGGEPTKLTDVSGGASSGTWSPSGEQVAFLATVRPEWSGLPFSESNAKNKAYDASVSQGVVKAKTFTRLMYRHWDSYTEEKRTHLFVIESDGSNCRDVTPGDRDAHPTSSTFVGGNEFAFSPDGAHLLFTAVPASGEAWSTNHDICRVSISNNKEDWQQVTSGPAAESSLQFSPDGKWVAYRAQAKPGYEADRWQLIVCPCNPDGTFDGNPSSWTESLDASVNDFAWTKENAVVFSVDHNGASAWYQVRKDASPVRIDLSFEDTRAGQLHSYTLHQDSFVMARASLTEPARLFTGELQKSGDKVLAATSPITHHNEDLLKGWERPVPESVTVPVEGDVEMQMWIVKPPHFDPSKKWPVVYMIHGGPQGAWGDGWSFRWNPQLWASQGYIIVLPNPRGSTGFGQKFCDEISGDWGGKCYRDLISGLEYLKSLPYVDHDRVASAGASFGGYMQNWFAVNEIAKEFKCFVNHCSVYNLDSMWGTTDELWFDEFEHGGTPWERPESYQKFNPQAYAGNLSKYKVPMLVIHNDLDFRCPIGQGHELFQALQRQGVESRFVNFPDEGHWVTKPANSILWHNEVFGWLKKYAPPGGK